MMMTNSISWHITYQNHVKDENEDTSKSGEDDHDVVVDDLSEVEGLPQPDENEEDTKINVQVEKAIPNSKNPNVNTTHTRRGSEVYLLKQNRESDANTLTHLYISLEHVMHAATFTIANKTGAIFVRQTNYIYHKLTRI